MFSILKNKKEKYYVICKYSPLVMEIEDAEIALQLSMLDQTANNVDEEFFRILGVKLPTPVHNIKRNVPFKFMEAIVTYDCNLSCSYCWQRTEGFQKEKAMDMNTFYKAVKLIAEYNKQFDYKGGYRIGYMGGEPLLRSDFIIEAHDMANQLLGTCESAILTNGTFLTDDYCKELVKRNISVCVSIDGPPAINYRRSSFEDTWRGIQTALDSNIPLSVQSTLSMSQIEQNAMVESARFFLENGIENFTILLESPVVNLDEDLLYKAYKNLLLVLIEYAEQTKRIPSIIKQFIHNISDSTYSMRNCFCRFLYPAGIQVDPYGNVFGCEFNRGKYHYGNIIEGIVTLESIPDRLRDVSKYNDPICNSCIYSGICYGYPRLCSLYNKDEICHMKAYYRACFDVLPERLKQLL
ncbi:radical SAM protein [Anaerocolumna sp. MB42-C2]|uniref:radical SAM protein n=1 Tax=Anaerocolumna sp. MB42-C2 TaxID=3070997 RepID=UPI0027DF8C67|nr:radical SAM protein [Anaerocolumna sp. MB42-C2]WMJ86438.1 radical SAM protein [Anaerocolumna sp. MB42-C2]